MTEPGTTPRIEVRVAIRRDVVASFEPVALSEQTGIPVEVLLTSFDTWDEGAAENFCDYMFDDTNYFGQPLMDWSTIEKYQIKEQE